ncbi:adenylyl-sulfate kinase [Pseudodesulfovibrio sp.]|nr:adenylyl-sulfate kinase [Pseudodesulfovibrio sp.]
MTKPFTLWLMGPTSSGKTTTAKALHARLKQDGVPCLHYDGDEVRDFYGLDFPFGAENRLRVVATCVHLANKAVEAGVHCIVSALTANEDARKYIAKHLVDAKIGYVHCDLNECIRRDPKGLYKKAINGEIDTLIGYNTPYAPPDKAVVDIDTDSCDVDQAVEVIFSALYSTGEDT